MVLVTSLHYKLPGNSVYTELLQEATDNAVKDYRMCISQR